MQAAVKWSGNGDLAGIKVAVQGCGQVGFALVKYLVEAGAVVVVAESSAARLEEVKPELERLGVQYRLTAAGDNSVGSAEGVAFDGRRFSRKTPSLFRQMRCGVLTQPPAHSRSGVRC